MASRAFLIAIFFAVAVAPTFAKDYMVGDDAGWTIGVNYTEWAAGKDFHVGDTLMFMYKPGAHNILKVNKTDFQQCVNSNASQIPFASGNDTIPLTSPGNKWYICGFPDHCSKGMKLVITVGAEGPAPSPTPGNSGTPPGTSAAVEASPLRSCVWMLAVMAAYNMIIV